MPVAEHLPVAQVRVDSPLPHLDRAFDYAVPASMADGLQPGVRVRVRLAGRLVDGLVVGRMAESSVPGSLRPVERLVSAEPVVTEQTLALIEAVAARYAGTFWDVYRAAVPPRHARAESAPAPELTLGPEPPGASWAAYPSGAAMLQRLAAGDAAVRAAWSAAPGVAWSDQVADALRAVLSRSGAGALVVVPDAWDVQQVRAALPDLADAATVLTADLGPEARYRAFTRILRGHSRLVIGTRAAVFAPVTGLRLVVVWNDAEEPMWEPHAPYWNARDVAALRSHLTGCSLLVGSPARSPEAQALCEAGWAASMVPTRAAIRSAAPVVRAIELADAARDEAAATARIPHTAWLVAKEALRAGPVLVQVARRGYLPAVACASCRAIAHCACGGALAVAAGRRVAACTVCGTSAAEWRCPSCSGTRLRAVAIGAERTAEEFGRAFPDVRIVWSSGDRLVRSVGPEPALVVATAGAEPIAEGGYAGVVLLDGRAQLQRAHLRAAEDAAQRWFGAAQLARPRAHVVVTADNAAPAVQALARWDAAWLAGRELADRAAAGLPPATRAAVLRGEVAAIREVDAALEVPHRLLGPIDGRAIVLAPREHGPALARELRAVSAVRSSKSLPVVTCQLDPRAIDP